MNNEIFMETERYFTQLDSKIKSKTREINRYLYQLDKKGGRSDSEMNKFIKTYLGTYGFMNITSMFKKIASLNEDNEESPKTTNKSSQSNLLKQK